MKDGDQIDRIQLLLDDRTETRVLLEKPRTRRTVHQTLTLDFIEHTNTNIPPSLNGSLSTLSTASSGYRHRNSDTSSRVSVTVTDASSVTAPHPGYVPPPALDQQLLALPYVSYDLPCEFGFIGCMERFHPFHSESWVDHTLSHFPHNLPPPSEAICIFCEIKFDRFMRQLDPEENWRQRMEHIHGHFRDGVPPGSARPDFFVIDHMCENGLISRSDHKLAMEYTERPYCEGLKPLGWEPEEKKLQRERDLQQPYDIGKEERTRRREHSRLKGKGR